MLDAGDQRQLREIEAYLLAEDPHFVAAMRGDIPEEQHGSAVALGGLWLVWAVTLIGISTVGWPIVAVNSVALLVLVVITVRVLRRRRLRPYSVG